MGGEPRFEVVVPTPGALGNVPERERAIAVGGGESESIGRKRERSHARCGRGDTRWTRPMITLRGGGTPPRPSVSE